MTSLIRKGVRPGAEAVSFAVSSAGEVPVFAFLLEEVKVQRLGNLPSAAQGCHTGIAVRVGQHKSQMYLRRREIFIFYFWG